MFRGAKWRSDRSKIKSSFKVQLQATQIPQTGWDSLLVVLIPSETGKPTAKTEKTQVHNGICKWENPIYETLKFARDAKNGKFEEKVYQFVVSNGSSRGVLGQTEIDFAEYADSIKPCSVSLPIGKSISTILHITIQRLHADGDSREEEKSTATRSPHSKSLRNHMTDFDPNESSMSTSTPNGYASKDNSADNGTIRFSPSVINTIPRLSEYDRNLKCFGSSDAISATSSSDGSSANDFSREYKSKSNINKDAMSIVSPLSIQTKSPLLANGHIPMRDQIYIEDTNTDWSLSSTPNASRENLTNLPRDTDLNEKLLITVEKLKKEIATMERQTELADLEIQTLRKQIVKESRKVQDFSKEINSLKEERDALIQECEQVKDSMDNDGIKLMNLSQYDSNHSLQVLEEVKEELGYEKDLNANLRLQLQKTQEANSELILAIHDLEALLKENNRETSKSGENHENLLKTAGNFLKHQTQTYQGLKAVVHEERDEEQLELDILINKNVGSDNKPSLDQKILELQKELDECRKYRVDMETQMEQLALDYEILKQENHDMAFRLEQGDIQEELKRQYESSMPLPLISDVETRVEDLENELAKQEEKFRGELASAAYTKMNLETYVHDLEKELDDQKKTFESELAAAIHAKTDLQARVQDLDNELSTVDKALHIELAVATRAKTDLETHVQDLEEALAKQKQAFESELAAVVHAKMDVEACVQDLKKELSKQEKTFQSELETVTHGKRDLEIHVDDLLRKLTMQEEAFKTELAATTIAKMDMEAHIENLKAELLRKGDELVEVTRVKHDLEVHVQNLEKELAEREIEFKSEFSALTNGKSHLETRLECLEKELAKQEETFEAELAMVTRAKVEEEKRAIRAEEMLRKTRQNNADTAERLQEEFKTLCTQMSAAFDANEKLAAQAMSEASNLRIQKIHLEQLLEKSTEEIQLVKDQYEHRLTELLEQLGSKENSINQLLTKVGSLSEELKSQKEAFSLEIFTLKGDIQVLITEKSELFKSIERKEEAVIKLDEMVTKMCEKELMFQKERTDLESQVLQAKEEAGPTQDELLNMRDMLLEKATLVDTLRTEIEMLTTQYSELKRSFSEDELEKESLRKQVFQLGSELEKKDDAIAVIEKKLKTLQRNAKPIPRNASNQSTRDVIKLQERIKLLEEEVKIRETTLRSSRNEFEGRERELQARFEELNKSSMDSVYNVADSSGGNTEKTSGDQCKPCLVHYNEQRTVTSNMNNPIDEHKPCHPDEGNTVRLETEIEQLKQKSNSMEDELKEMQERYSEISLKFAEVEGERQQLIMAVRNLKNGKRT